jgi:rhomboid protease GluP
VFSLFVHVHFLQFFLIVFSIYILAPQLEWFFGKIPFLLLFLLTGTVGNLGVYLMGIEGTYTGATESIYGLLGFYLYLYFRGMIHPSIGRGILVYIVLNLAFGYALLFAHVLALLCGIVVSAFMIQIKQMLSDQLA